MVKDKTEINWIAVWLNFKGNLDPFFDEPENESTPRQRRASGLALTQMRELQKLGVELEIPPEVIAQYEPKPAPVVVAEPVKESPSIPKVVFDSTLGKAGSILGRIGHALKVVPEEPKEEG
jgi:hypothetical protein